MNFDHLIQYKALDRIHSLSGSDLVDRVSLPDDQKVQMKNVCALIHVSLFEELETMCGLLGLSKRQFIEACLVDGLAKAEKIMEDLEFYQQFQEAHAEGVSNHKQFAKTDEAAQPQEAAKGRSK